MQVRKHEISVSEMTTAMVWNVPLRLFHWTLASCFIAAWLTLGDRYLDVHVFAGYLMAGLILFRLLWGMIGGPYARFSDFVFSWRTTLNYIKALLKWCPPRFIGHNPAASLAIYLLLILGGLVVTTGLLTLGGEERQGPLAGWLSFPQGEIAHKLHEVLAWLMLIAVAIHLFGVAVESLVHRENLLGAMITGYKSVPPGATSTAATWSAGIFMLIVMITAGVGWFYGYLMETPEQPYRPFIGRQLPDNALWREECGSCHLAFHPSLLPTRSWKILLQDQAAHFGEDLYLEQDAVAEIKMFLLDNSAEKLLTEAAWKINRSIPESKNLLRITETPYWIKKHKKISAGIWEGPRVNGKVNCAACHLDADAGTFEDAAMRIPAKDNL